MKNSMIIKSIFNLSLHPNSEKNYYNGKIGVVTFVNDSEIKIKSEVKL